MCKLPAPHLRWYTSDDVLVPKTCNRDSWLLPPNPGPLTPFLTVHHLMTILVLKCRHAWGQISASNSCQPIIIALCLWLCRYFDWYCVCVVVSSVQTYNPKDHETFPASQHKHKLLADVIWNHNLKVYCDAGASLRGCKWGVWREACCGGSDVWRWQGVYLVILRVLNC